MGVVGNFCFQGFFIFIISPFDIFTSRFHHVEPDLCSEFSSVLRAAIFGSRLLKIVRKIGFCGLHFFAQMEIEDVVFDVNWNELFSFVPTHLPFEVYPHFLANVAVHWNHETTVRPQLEILMSFARDVSRTAQNFVCTGVLRSELGTNHFLRHLETAKLHQQAMWTEVQWTCVYCSSLVSGFIFTHSKRFGLLIAPRSKTPSECELAELS